jgi:FAD/FMN-containing dehydrogenase/Fe-S oxidoreductase
MEKKLNQLATRLEGELHSGKLMRILYATDASIYRAMPLAVAFPRGEHDIIQLIKFAGEEGISLIPRTAGTSLAGQCVGEGIVVDVSRYLNRILELNVAEQWVRIQPGVVRDELNAYLKPFGLFFGPNTATASRCMLGGMVGNNSCGSTSIKYGTTRDHVMALRTVLSDASVVEFSALSPEQFEEKKQLSGLEGTLYRQLWTELSKPERQAEIRKEYPKPGIHRRNTGYAVDVLLDSELFTPGGPEFNMCKMLAGSEGTLAFTTEITLHLNALPPAEDAMVCAHFDTLDQSLRAAQVAMQYAPYSCELMDKYILDCTKENRAQQQNRFFLEGDPAAILMVEFRGETREEANQTARAMIADLEAAGLGYAYPVVSGPQTQQVFALRAAGFGVLSNVRTDAKPLEFVEDGAVDLADLPAYIADFATMMAGFGQKSVYYAHAGAGELHPRPTINLKTRRGVSQMRQIAEASARLIKKYNGSLSGEHGDGRVRGEFIPLMIGESNYQLLRRIKQTWDPQGLFNPGKIVDTPPMDTSLRYVQDTTVPSVNTVFDFSATKGLLGMAEKCSGSGDCRKLPEVSGGTMCPSYMATRNERDTTRARANALREFLTRTADGESRLAHDELYEVMSLCLSCKGCSSECPSNVDMATMKAEFLHHYYKEKGVPFRAMVFGHIGQINALASLTPALSNLMLGSRLTAPLIKQVLGVAPQRSLPALHSTSLRRWWKKTGSRMKPTGSVKGRVYFFCDEFTNYNDVTIGIKAISLLIRLGYEVLMPEHADSGRAQLSKGLLPAAQACARENVYIFSELVSEVTPLVGIEPSAILGFRDEYPKLVTPLDRDLARNVGKHALLIDEFLAREFQKGNISSDSFHKESKKVLLHGHCHQKALSSVDASAWVLGIPEQYAVSVIPSGCCGMAGSFGYEAEHYEVSMQVGELVLFPALRKAGDDVIIAAPGTSCRHQIADGIGKKALHPVEVLWNALL